MTEETIQLLTILAYLAIGLLSVTFPIYAISVNYLPQEKWEGEQETKKRIDELKRKIAEKTDELQRGPPEPKKATELQEQIGKYRDELAGAKQRCQYLTAKGAVGYPSVALAIALLFVGLAIHYYYEAVQLHTQELENRTLLFGALAVLSIVYAVYRLYKTVSAVEVAALRPYKTVEFQIGFGNGFETSAKVKVGKSADLVLSARTNEIDIDNFTIGARCPTGMQVNLDYKRPEFVTGQTPSYDSITYFASYIPKGFTMGFHIIFTPRSIETYTLVVRVMGKGICDTKKDLTIEVIP